MVCFLLALQTKVCVRFPSPPCTLNAQSILIIILFGKEYKLRNSLPRNFLEPPVIYLGLFIFIHSLVIYLFLHIFHCSYCLCLLSFHILFLSSLLLLLCVRRSTREPKAARGGFCFLARTDWGSTAVSLSDL